MSKILLCSLIAVALALASPTAAHADAPLSDAGPASAALTAPVGISGQEAAIEALVTQRVLQIETQRAAQAHPPLEVQPLPLQLTGDPQLDRMIVFLTMIAGIVGAICSLLANFVPPTSAPGKVISWLALNFGKRLHPPGPPPPDTIAKTALIAFLLFGLGGAAAAHADAPPAPVKVTQALPQVADSDPPPSSTYGGCVGPWTCFQPSVSIAPLALNLRTKTVEAGFQPGVGYGVTFHKGQWYSFGVDAYVNLDVGAQRFAVAVMGKAVNGYLRFGWSKGFIGDSNATSPRLLFGVGTDL